MAVYPSGRFWVTVNQEHFTLSTDTEITIPAGYMFDGHSIPVPFNAFINPYSADMRAALLHDWLYDRKDKGDCTYTRKQVDLEYLYEMEACGTNWFRRYTLYTGVRLLGWIWWYF